MTWHPFIKLVLRLHLWPMKSESLRVKLMYQYFLKVPCVSPINSQAYKLVLSLKPLQGQASLCAETDPFNTMQSTSPSSNNHGIMFFFTSIPLLLYLTSVNFTLHSTKVKKKKYNATVILKFKLYRRFQIPIKQKCSY